MRSVAHGELEKTQIRPTLVPLANQGVAPDPPHPAPDPEQVLAADQDAATTKAAILAIFEGDTAAQVIVEGIMEGMEGEELRQLTELDKTAYNSKRRLIRRHIDRKFPRGGKP